MPNRKGAEVGTDSGTIYAIDPAQLVHVIEDSDWLQEWDDGTEKADKIIRQHGGAVFSTGGDGIYNVKIPTREDAMPIVKEQGYMAPYGQPKEVKENKEATERVARAYLKRALILNSKGVAREQEQAFLQDQAAVIKSLGALATKTTRVLKSLWPEVTFTASEVQLGGFSHISTDVMALVGVQARLGTQQKHFMSFTASYPLQTPASERGYFTSTGRKELGMPRFGVSFAPSRIQKYISQAKLPTSAQVLTLLNGIPHEDVIYWLGGPLKGKQVASLAAIRAFLDRKTYMRFDGEQRDTLMYSTREHGHFTDERESPGEEDLGHASKVERLLLTEFGSSAIDVDISTTDEWTLLTIRVK